MDHCGNISRFCEMENGSAFLEELDSPLHASTLASLKEIVPLKVNGSQGFFNLLKHNRAARPKRAEVDPHFLGGLCCRDLIEHGKEGFFLPLR